MKGSGEQTTPEPEDPQSKTPEITDGGSQDVDTGEVVEGEVVEGEVVGPDGRISPDRVQFTAKTFSGPLPPPTVLDEYDQVVPGLAREIVDQWKGETTHRHKTIDSLRETDLEAMRSFYKAELVGQIIAGVLFIAILAIVAYAIERGDTVAAVAESLRPGRLLSGRFAAVAMVGALPHRPCL